MTFTTTIPHDTVLKLCEEFIAKELQTKSVEVTKITRDGSANERDSRDIIQIEVTCWIS